MECSGSEPALTLAIRATTGGGTIASIGRSGKPTQDLPLFEAMDKEIDIIGSFRYRNTYAKVRDCI
jgi:L-iditol 2-dehydrogenase